MKKYINYFYNMDVDDLNFDKIGYIFKNNGKKYILRKCENLDFELYWHNLKEVLDRYFYFFRPVANKDGFLVTEIDNQLYILFLIPNIVNDKLSVFDIKSNMYVLNTEKINFLVRFPWIRLWENKIDYLEKWMSNKNKKYENLYPIFNFFIGLSENALSYLKDNLIKNAGNINLKMSIQHNRLSSNSSLYDYYDPLNVIIDYNVRDISEYVKSLILDDAFDVEILMNYLNLYSFSTLDIEIMYSRILFPTFFFDCLEESIIKNDFKKILLFEDKIKKVILCLNQIGFLFYKNYNISKVDWLFKNTNY